ncbi:STAS domain-containing protein [Kitasatospora sp. NPDC096147]|uniref:STAS domain-containing protein n=1 Tax=Kitasatospora sp. NPDC096147 TaxID=3364093 RepID=UPI00381AF524
MTTAQPADRADHADHGAAAPHEQFHCRVERTGSALLLAPCGDLDATVLPLLTAPLELIGPGTGLVRLDLAGVGFMDSSGVSLLIRAHRRCARAGARLEVSGLRPQHRLLLNLLGHNPPLPATA